MNDYDVIVVGAGPAGSSAAAVTAVSGARTLLIDRKRTPGTPKECAEGLGKGAIANLGLRMRPEWISNEYDSVKVGILGTGSVAFRTSRTKGCVLNRKVFDRDLSVQAEANGAVHLYGTAVRAVSFGRDGVMVTTSCGQYRAKMVIAADGPQSRIAYAAGLGKLKCSHAFQYEIDGAYDEQATLQILICPEFGFDVHCWVFPKKDSVNVGVSSGRPDGLKGKLDELVCKLNLGGRKKRELNAGLLPGKNKLERIYADRLLVAGDAAGHTNPFSGGGIAMAIHDGRLAGRIASAAVKRGRFDSGFLSRYQSEWDGSLFSRSWRVGFQAKAELEKYLSSGQMKGIFSKLGDERIDSRKGVIRKFMSKGFTLREAVILYRMVIVKFGKMIDYV